MPRRLLGTIPFCLPDEVVGQGQRRQAAADGAVQLALGEARSLRQQAHADPLTVAAFDKAVSAAGKAADMARAGGASETVQHQADHLLTEVTEEAEKAAQDRRLLTRLLHCCATRKSGRTRKQ
jgi:hypothetical protein